MHTHTHTHFITLTYRGCTHTHSLTTTTLHREFMTALSEKAWGPNVLSPTPELSENVGKPVCSHTIPKQLFIPNHDSIT